MYLSYEDAEARKNRTLNKLILFLLICFLAISNIVWLANDTRPPSWDQSTHLHLSVEYLEIISNPSWDIVSRLLNVSSYYPPFYHLSLIPSHLIFGVCNHLAALINIIYLALIVIFTYKIATHFFDTQTGLLAAFFISMYQFLIYLSRSCLIDVALTALVVMSIYYLLRTENFNNRNYSVIFGILFGIGMLTKWTFLFFLFAPLLLVLVRVVKYLKKPFIFIIYLTSLIFLIIAGMFLIFPYNLLIFIMAVFVGWRLLSVSRENDELFLNIKNIFLSALVAFIISAPWYLYNLIKLVRHITSNVGQIAVAEGDPSLLSFSSFLYYFRELSVQIQFIFFVLFLIGIVFFFVKWNKKKTLLVLWLFIPYIIFIFVRNKDPRFTVPYLPAVSIISVAWLSMLRNKNLRRVIIGLIIVIGIRQFFLFSYNIKGFPQEATLNTPLYNFSLYSCYPPLREDWKHKEIFTAIAENSESSGRPFALVRVLSNYQYFHGESFEIYTLANNLPIYPIGYRKNLGEFTDYIIFKTEDRGPAFSITHYDEALKQIENNDIVFTGAFTTLKEVSLPDGSQGIVYKRDVKPCKEMKLNEIEARLKQVLISFLQAGQDLNVEIIPFSENATSKGRFKKIVIKADNTKIKGVSIGRMYVELEDIWLNLYNLMKKNELLLFSLDKLTPELVINEDDLQDLIKKRNKLGNIKNLKISLNDGLIKLTGTLNLAGMDFPFNVTGKIILDRDKNAIFTRVKRINLGPFKLPSFLYNSILKREFSLHPTADWALETNINQIMVDKGKFVLR